MFAAALEKAELSGFRVYDLRHTFASLLLAQGAPVTYVSAQLGHSRPTTTLQWYAHWLPGGRERFMDGLAGRATTRQRKCPICFWRQIGAHARRKCPILVGRQGLEPWTR